MLRPYQPLMSIVPEGWGVIGALGGGAVLLSLGGALLPSLALLAAMPAAAGFCFDPAHGVSSKPRGILSPVNGTVIHRRECHDPVLGREAIRLVIRTSWWGGYCLRAPISGLVAPLPADIARQISRLRSDDGDELLIEAQRGALFGARPVMVPLGERVGQGRRCGLRRLARELVVVIPAGARVEVGLGSRVRSGQTLLATLLRRT